MNWEEAINKSDKGTATRIMILDKKKGLKRTIIRYRDGSGYSLASKDGKVDFFLSRQATDFEMEGYNDWEPTL